MTTSSTIGHWGKLFGRRMSFEMEAAKAIEIGAQWRFDPRQVDVVLDYIPGHERPAWGSDSKWLYLRRPEGVWKTRLGEDLGDRRVMLCQQDGAGGIVGAMPIGPGIENQKGWLFEGGQAIEAAEIDDRAAAAVAAHGVDADKLGAPLFDFVEWSDAKAIVSAGEAFGHDRLAFDIVGQWLIVSDRQDGRKVAYDISANKVVTGKCMAGQLWLRFVGEWMRPVDVHVGLNARVEAIP